MKHTLFLSGATVDLTLPSADILTAINKPLSKCYPGNLVMATDYSELDDRTCQITIKRELPSSYSNGLGGDCINYIDESILSGMPEKYFVLDVTGQTKPMVAPLLPMYDCWFTPKLSFYSLFRTLHKTMAKEELSRVKIQTNTDAVIITIKYPKKNGKYDDDIHDLEADLGDTLDNHRGGTLTYKLGKLAEICERTYIKTKSYRGLKSYLKKKYDINLDIK